MGRRWANIKIHESMLSPLLGGARGQSITSDWPMDAMVVHGSWDQRLGMLTLTVESSMFDEVPVGNVIPDWTPTFTAHLVEPSATALMELIERSQKAS